MRLDCVIVPESKEMLKETKLHIDGNILKGHNSKLVEELPVTKSGTIWSRK